MEEHGRPIVFTRIVCKKRKEKEMLEGGRLPWVHGREGREASQGQSRFDYVLFRT